MWSMWGAIITGMLIIGLLGLLFLVKNIFSDIKVSKNGGLELSKDRRCEDRLCDEGKLLRFMLQITDNRMRIMNLDLVTFNKQKKYAKQKFSELKYKVVELLNEASKEAKESPSERGEVFFRAILKSIFFDMQEKFEDDIDMYENTDEDHFMIIRREIVSSIPELVKSSLPVTHILPSKVFSGMMDKFSQRYSRDFAPVIEDIIDRTRRFSKEKNTEKDYLECELKSIVKKYTEGIDNEQKHSKRY